MSSTAVGHRQPTARLLGIAVVVLFFLALYGRFLVGWAPSGGDTVNQYLPYQQLIREAVRAGEAPLYNAMTFCGRPLMGDVQVGVLYPPNWLHWLLPLPLSFALLLAAHGVWMLAGCWLLARRFGLHPAAAALGAVLFAGAPFFTHKLSLGVVLFIYVGAWWPWLALAAARLVERPGAGRMSVLGLVVALSLLAGSPQVTFYGWIATWCFALALPGTDGRRWPWRLAWLGGAFALAAALSAVQVLQTLHFIGNSFERAGGAGWEYITDGSLAPRLWWLLVNPGFLGVGHMAHGYYWAFPPDYAEVNFYLPLWSLALLAPVGAGLIFNPPERAQRRMALLGVAAVVLGLALAPGEHSPLFELFYRFAPGFDRFRVPARLMIFYTAGIALLAALGYHRLLTARIGRGTLGLLAAGALAALAVLWGSYALRIEIWRGLGAIFLQPGGGMPGLIDILNRHALVMAARVSMFLLLAILALTLAAKRRWEWALFLVPLLAAAELVWLAWPFQSSGEPLRASTRISEYEERLYPTTELIEALRREHRGGRILWLNDVMDWKFDQNQPEIYPNRLIMHGLPEARGYDPVNARWIGLWMNLLAGFETDQPPGGFMYVDMIARPAMLTLMGVETVLSYADLSDVPGLTAAVELRFPLAEDIALELRPRIKELRRDPTTGESFTVLTLWRNERFRGLAFPAPMSPLLDDPDQALFYTAQTAENPERAPEQAIVIDPAALMTGIRPTIELDERFRVRALPSGPNSFRYETDYPEPALLCLAQSRWPDWIARVDGEPVPVSFMSGAFLAVAVPAGRHEVVFDFHPAGLDLGIWISLGALIFMIYVWVRCWLLARLRGKRPGAAV